MKKKVLTLNFGQLAKVYADRLKGLLQRGISLEEALLQIRNSLAAEVAEARELAQDALAEVFKYERILEGGVSVGILPDKRARLGRYIAEGVRDAEEQTRLLALPTKSAAQKRRLHELEDELVKDAANVQALRASIQSDEALLAKWQERYEERLATLKRLQADFETLQSEGPALIAQIRDAERAEEAREADRDRELGVGDNATAMLDDLREQAAAATRREEAGEQLDEALAGEPSLDDELAARERDEALRATIAEFQQMAGGK